MATENSESVVHVVVSVLNGVTFICNVFFLAAVLSKKENRVQPYNLYLVALIIPDALNSLGSVLFYTVFPTFEVGSPTTVAWCREIYFVGYFYFYSNFLINAVVAYEIHQMVIKSHRRMRARPPSIRRVCLQCGCAYSVALLVSIWAVIDVSWSSQTFYYDNEITCIVLPSEKVPWFVPLFIDTVLLFLVPLVYVIYVRIHIGIKGLLPRTGRTRVLSLYFFRILIIFIGCYLPFMLIHTVLIPLFPTIKAISYVALFFGTIQTFLTLGFAMGKPDVKEAVAASLKISSLTVRASTKMSVLTKSWKKGDEESADSTINNESNENQTDDKTITRNTTESSHVSSMVDENNANNIIDSDTQVGAVIDEWEQDDVYDES